MHLSMGLLSVWWFCVELACIEVLRAHVHLSVINELGAPLAIVHHRITPASFAAFMRYRGI